MALAMNSMTKQNKKTNKKEAKKLSKAQKQKKKKQTLCTQKFIVQNSLKLPPPLAHFFPHYPTLPSLLLNKGKTSNVL